MTDQGFRSMREGDPDFAYQPPRPVEERLPPPIPAQEPRKLSETEKLVERITEIARQNYSLARGECTSHFPDYLALHWESLPEEQRELFVNLGLTCVQLGREMKA